MLAYYDDAGADNTNVLMRFFQLSAPSARHGCATDKMMLEFPKGQDQ